VWKDGSGLESVAFRALMGNGDVLAGPGERIGLYPEALPLRLSLEPPKLDLWMDTTLTVAAGTPTAGAGAHHRRHQGRLRQGRRPGHAEAPASIAYAAVREAVTNIIPPGHRAPAGHRHPPARRAGRRARRRHRPGQHRPPRTAMPRKLTLRVEGSDG
jgi:hypothetical protein